MIALFQTVRFRRLHGSSLASRWRLVIDFVLKTSRSALLSWQATRFARNVENEGVARFLRAPNGAFEREPAAVHVNRYAAAAALADYHSGQARLVLIDLPFVGIALIVMAIVGGAMVLVPASLFFRVCCACHRSRSQIPKNTRCTHHAGQSKI